MPYLILGGAQLAVGAAAIFARFALLGAGPVAVSAARLTIAALILLAVHFVSRSNERVGARANVVLAVAGLMLAIHFVAWIGSLQYTSIAVSVLLVSTTPIWTAIYDAVAFKRLPTLSTMAAFAGGGCGLWLVIGFDHTLPPIPGHDLFGALLALLGSLGIGAYFILVREVRNEFGTRTIVTRTYSVAAIVLIASALAARQPTPPVDDHAAWAGIVAMALVSQLLGHTALNASLRWFSPSTIAFTILLEPVFAAALGLVVFHETIPPAAIVGAIVLLASIGVVLRDDRALA